MKEFFIMEANLLRGSEVSASLFAPRDLGQSTPGKKKGPRKARKSREAREHATELTKYAPMADCRDGL